jgi:predicted nuclease of predicted toxin-antitoxin system
MARVSAGSSGWNLWRHEIHRAQLPRRLARELVAAGHDVAHALELPLGNRTPDGDIAALAVREGRVVVTKDSDFVTTFLLQGTPPKLLLISTGNISNEALSRLITANLTALETAFAKHDFIELSVSAITIHA